MKSKYIHNKIILFIITALIIFIMIPYKYITKAEERQYKFDTINVLDDLKSVKGFDLLKYPKDLTGILKSPSIINFTEYCYSYKQSVADDFALYIYFYNPQDVSIDITSMSNRIQIASAYDKYPIGNDSAPTDFETYNLIFCNKSETKNTDNIFYKFRVVDHKSADGLTIRERVNSVERRYDVSGLVLATTDGIEKEYTVGGSYRFSGYAKGYGSKESSKSTLENVSNKSIETIRLDVKSTTYRTTSSSLGVGHQNDINSVYFSLPDKYINEYGNLQKIKAEWYEYKTEDIYIIDNYAEAYEAIMPKVGKSVGKNGDGTYSFAYGLSRQTVAPTCISSFNYNPKYPAYMPFNNIDKIYYLFNSNSNQEILVSSEELINYINDYDKTYEKGTLPVKNGRISADLFKDEVDSGRTKGYNIKEVDTNDKFNILSYDSKNNAWKKFWDYGFTKIDTNDGRNEVAPIYIVKDSDVSLSSSNMANKLLISKEDTAEFKNYVNTEKINKSSTVLFRFAQTDYYSQNGSIWKKDSNTRKNVYQASETVFIDFKIIQLTFSKDNECTIIPIAQNPIDIIPGVTPTPGETPSDWLKNLLNKLGAWGTLVAGITVGALMLLVEIATLKGTSSIGSLPIKIILLIMVLGLSIAGDYFVIKFFMESIARLGGL